MNIITIRKLYLKQITNQYQLAKLNRRKAKFKMMKHTYKFNYPEKITSCYYCPVYNDVGDTCELVEGSIITCSKDKPDWCPLVEIEEE